MEKYFFTLYLALVAFLANMAPVFGARLDWLRVLNRPIDGGRKIRKKRILGQNKTVRGLVLAVLAGIIVGFIQFCLEEFKIAETEQLSGLVDFISFGFWGGLGAILGDAIFSFIKRQLDVASGRPFFPFDQIDYIIGFLFFTSLLIDWKYEQIVFLLVFAIVANPLVNLVGYLLKIKNTYW